MTIIEDERRPLDYLLIIQLRSEGLSYAAIARHFGCSGEAVRLVLAKKAPTFTRRNSRYFVSEREAQRFLALRANNKTLAEIALECGRSVPSVRAALRRLAPFTVGGPRHRKRRPEIVERNAEIARLHKNGLPRKSISRLLKVTMYVVGDAIREHWHD